jgi:hypothetical protein
MPINSRGAASLWMTPYAASLALANEIYKFDEQYDQLASVSGGWTISGVADGQPFSFSRQDAWSGWESLAAGTLYEDLESMIEYGTTYGDTALEINTISPDLDIAAGLNFYRLQKAEVRVGSGEWSSDEAVFLGKGEMLSLRLTFKPNTGPSIERVLQYRGTGQEGFLGLGVDDFSESSPESFSDLLETLGQQSNSKLRSDSFGLEYVSGDLAFDRPVSGQYFLGVDVAPDPAAEIAPLKISGPSKVRQGKRATWKVRVRNIGDDTLRGVRFRASGRGIRVNLPVGNLAPGKSSVEKITVRPKKAGKLRIRVSVRANNAPDKKAQRVVRIKG